MHDRCPYPARSSCLAADGLTPVRRLIAKGKKAAKLARPPRRCLPMRRAMRWIDALPSSLVKLVRARIRAAR
jgi:hypothetical protein